MNRTEITFEKEEAVNDLEWEILKENEQQEYLTKKVRKKNTYDFLKSDSPSRQRIYDYSTNGMKYVTS